MDLPNYDFSLLPVRVNNRVYFDAKIMHFMHEIMQFKNAFCQFVCSLGHESFISCHCNKFKVAYERTQSRIPSNKLGPQCAQTHRSQDAHKILVQSVK